MFLHDVGEPWEDMAGQRVGAQSTEAGENVARSVGLGSFQRPSVLGDKDALSFSYREGTSPARLLCMTRFRGMRRSESPSHTCCISKAWSLKVSVDRGVYLGSHMQNSISRGVKQRSQCLGIITHPLTSRSCTLIMHVSHS